MKSSSCLKMSLRSMEIFVEQATPSKLMLMSKVRIGNHAQANMQKWFLLGTARVVHNNG